MGIHSTIHPTTRAAIEAQIERLIDMLDQIDGDCDLEDANDVEDDFALSFLALGYGAGRGPGCVVSDVGGGNVEDEGEEEEERELAQHYQMIPVYGVDQSQGAINRDLAERRERLADQVMIGSKEVARQARKRLNQFDASLLDILSARGAVFA